MIKACQKIEEIGKGAEPPYFGERDECHPSAPSSIPRVGGRERAACHNDPFALD